MREYDALRELHADAEPGNFTRQECSQTLHALG